MEHADDLMAFIAASPSPYHAAASVAARLEAGGFRRVREEDAWGTEPGGRYLVRGGTVVAWVRPDAAKGGGGGSPTSGGAGSAGAVRGRSSKGGGGGSLALRGRSSIRGFAIFGAHTDSPTLTVKPRPDTGAAGWRQVAVEVYGGPLRNSWLDRDLGIAGRLVTRGGEAHLVSVDRPLLRVPQLAVHLDRAVNEGLKLDPQRHMTPIWGLGQVTEGDLIDFLAAEAGVSGVAGWDLTLHDLQPPAYLGRDRELMAAPRLDNLISVHAGTTALLAAAGTDAGGRVPVLAAFDHEETGSASATGAAGPLLERVLRRVAGGDVETQARAFAGSLCVSSDVGHAVHPNYPERHEPGHHPLPNGGPILKVNATQRYATNGAGRAAWADICGRAGVPWQFFVGNNAIPCGSTIGPITATRLGVDTVDVGVPILSMHSVRELCGAADPGLLARAATAFLTG